MIEPDESECNDERSNRNKARAALAPATGSARCRLCGRTALEIGGYLHRVNEKGVKGIWECRPSCDAKLSNSEAILAAIEGPNDQAH